MTVALGSPADKLGIKKGDIILSVNGKETNSVVDLRTAIAECAVGDTVEVVYERKGSKITESVKLAEMPAE